MFLKNKEKLKRKQEEVIQNLAKFTDKLIDGTIRKLYEIQDVQNLGVSEEEKNKHRNIIINISVKELLEYSGKIKEVIVGQNK